MDSVYSYSDYLASLFQKINFGEAAWLIEKYEETINDRLVNLSRKLPKVIKDSENDVDANVFQTLGAIYLEEIWISELVPPYTVGSETRDIVFAVIEGVDSESVLQKLKEEERHELVNLINAARYLFGHDFHNPSNHPISKELICHVHKLVLQGKDFAGTFRKTGAAPFLSTLTYCPPKKIETRLAALIAFVDLKMKTVDGVTDFFEKMKLLLRIGTIFFSEFLLIHPFKDGNGRTARLLLNHLLRDQLLIPFSLYFKDRAMYIQVLEERNNVDTPPNALAVYLVKCLERTLGTATFLLLN